MASDSGSGSSETRAPAHAEAEPPESSLPPSPTEAPGPRCRPPTCRLPRLRRTWCSIRLRARPRPRPRKPPRRPRRRPGALPRTCSSSCETSPLGADIDHIGDRLLVFVDRVELRDRNDRLRQVLSGEDITDVVVQRKFTGAVLAVESGSGEAIVTRGLKPEQADQARLLIHKRTRAGRPVAPKEAEKPRSPQRPNPSVNGPKPPDVSSPSPDAVAAAAARLAILNRDRLNEADLLRKLADLHRAGVLTDIEFEEKIALVGRLVSGETLVVV